MSSGAAAWARLSPREQQAIAGAAWVVGGAALWWLVGAPAWQIWQHGPTQHRLLDAQWQQVHTLAAQARGVQAQAVLSKDDRLRALETATQERLGASAKLQVSGTQATVTLQRAPAEGVAQWLAQVRVNARLTPAESRLTRDAATPSVSPSSAAPARASLGATGPTWSGTFVLVL